MIDGQNCEREIVRTHGIRLCSVNSIHSDCGIPNEAGAFVIATWRLGLRSINISIIIINISISNYIFNTKMSQDKGTMSAKIFQGVPENEGEEGRPLRD